MNLSLETFLALLGIGWFGWAIGIVIEQEAKSAKHPENAPRRELLKGDEFYPRLGFD